MSSTGSGCSDRTRSSSITALLHSCPHEAFQESSFSARSPPGTSAAPTTVHNAYRCLRGRTQSHGEQTTLEVRVAGRSPHRFLLKRTIFSFLTLSSAGEHPVKHHLDTSLEYNSPSLIPPTHRPTRHSQELQPSCLKRTQNERIPNGKTQGKSRGTNKKKRKKKHKPTKRRGDREKTILQIHFISFFRSNPLPFLLCSSFLFLLMF